MHGYGRRASTAVSLSGLEHGYGPQPEELHEGQQQQHEGSSIDGSSMGFGTWAELSNSSGWRRLALQQQRLEQLKLQEDLEQQQFLGSSFSDEVQSDQQGVAQVQLLQGDVMVGRHPTTNIPPMTSAAAIAAAQGADIVDSDEAVRSSFPQYEHLVSRILCSIR